MPVKVRCECGAGINAPDAARGRTIKCRSCGGPVRVPGGPRKKKAQRDEPSGPSLEDDDFFEQLNMDRVEDRDVKICPRCAEEVDEEDIECPSCGINLETGILSEKQKRKRKNKGPDPDEFYKVAWKDSFNFAKKNLSIVIRLAMSFSMFTTMSWAAMFMAVLWCERIPIIVFWAVLSGVAASAANGCFWQLSGVIVKMTLNQEEEIKRFTFDFFTDVSLGIKMSYWPLVLNAPLLWLIVAPASFMIAGGQLDLSTVITPAVIVGYYVLYALPILALPVAQSHMAAKYTYKAYLPWHMLRITFKNFAPTAFWWVMAFVWMLPVAATVVACGWFFPDLLLAIANLIVKINELCGVEIEPEQRGFMFYTIGMTAGLLTIYLSMLVTSAMLCFSAVVMMRANGLFAYYNERSLEMSERRKAGDPAGFWPRYLQYTIDALLVGIFQGIALGMLWGVNAIFNYLEVDMSATIGGVGRLIMGLVPFLYFIMTESSPGRGTMGMAGMGMVVVNADGTSPITKPAAIARYFARMIGIGFFMAIYDPEKRTWHDKVTKTKVVWKAEYD